MHRDLKPVNIDIIDTFARCVLFDLDTAVYVQSGAAIVLKSGSFGTICYLAPEMEMVAYDRLVHRHLDYGGHPVLFYVRHSPMEFCRQSVASG